MQGPTQRGAVAELGVDHCGGDRDAGGAHLSQQRQRLAPLFAKRERRGNAPPDPPEGGEPGFRQIQLRADEPRLRPGPQRRGDGDLVVADLAQRPRILAVDPHRRGALLGKARAVEHQHAFAGWNRCPQSAPHGLRTPRRRGDEVLQRLVAARVAQPLPHRLHRLATAVAQRALHVPAQAAPLGAPAEIVFEDFQPGQQTSEPRGRRVIEHCTAAYLIHKVCTREKCVGTREFLREFRESTK